MRSTILLAVALVLAVIWFLAQRAPDTPSGAANSSNTILPSAQQMQPPTFSVVEAGTTYYGARSSNIGVAILNVTSSPYLVSIGEPTKADGTFVIVTVAIFNGQNTAITMDTGLFELLDHPSNNVYSASVQSMEVDSASDLFLAQINPGITKTGKVIFDVPKNLNLDNLQLSFRGGMTGDVAVIPLRVNSKAKQLSASAGQAEGTQSDDQAAPDLAAIRAAAEQGGVAPQAKLGMMYRNGQGVPQDYAEAYFWLDIAASQPEWVKSAIIGTSEADSEKLQHFNAWYTANAAFFNWADKWRDEAASHLASTELSQLQERVRNWHEDHPAKVE